MLGAFLAVAAGSGATADTGAPADAPPAVPAESPPAVPAESPPAVPAEGARVLFTVSDPRLVEVSGLAGGTVEGLTFAIEDAGRPATVYALDDNGRIRQTVDVPGVENLDWEDVARGTDDAGAPALFVADTGDAFITLRDRGEPPRTQFSVVRLAEPQPDLSERVGVLPARVDARDVVVFPLRYADGEAKNAEALAVQPGTNRLFLVNKVGDGGRQPYLWAAPAVLDPAAPNVLTQVAPLPVTNATAAAFSPAGDLLVVRSPDAAYVWEVDDDDVAASVAREPLVLGLPEQRQGEALTFTADGAALLLASEGRLQPVWTVPIPADVGGAGAPAAPDDEASPTATDPAGTTAADADAAPAWPWAAAAAAVAALAGVALLRRRRR